MAVSRILVLCQSLIKSFGVKVHGGKKVADRSAIYAFGRFATIAAHRSAIIAFGSWSEPRRSGEPIPTSKVDKVLACAGTDCQGALPPLQ